MQRCFLFAFIVILAALRLSIWPLKSLAGSFSKNSNSRMIFIEILELNHPKSRRDRRECWPKSLPQMAKQQTQGAKDSPRVDVQEVAQRSMEVSIQIEKVHWTKCNFFKIQPTKRPPSLKVRPWYSDRWNVQRGSKYVFLPTRISTKEILLKSFC